MVDAFQELMDKETRQVYKTIQGTNDRVTRLKGGKLE
jgi:hypothetical protein